MEEEEVLERIGGEEKRGRGRWRVERRRRYPLPNLEKERMK
jgi:hypothetical protein